MVSAQVPNAPVYGPTHAPMKCFDIFIGSASIRSRSNPPMGRLELVDRLLHHACGVHVDLVLLDVAAHGRDFGHTWHGIELVPDEPVLQAAEIAE